MTSPAACPLCGAAAGPGRRLPAGPTVVTCPDCGLLYTLPRPTAAELAALYPPAYHEAWGLREHGAAVAAMKTASFDRWLDLLEQHISPGRLLDLGCATGLLVRRALDRGWDAVGVDVSPWAVRQARELVGRDRVRQGELAQADLPQGVWSAVTACDWLEHVLDPVDTVARIARLLKPGGLLLLTTPQVGSLSWRVMGSRWTHYKAEHLQYFSVATLRRLLATAGLELLHTAPARKSLSLDYVRAQFATYPHPLLTPLTRLAWAAAPAGLRTRPFAVPAGDLLALARRPPMV